MLPINFQGTDLTAGAGAEAPATPVSTDADTPVGGFADLLRQPVQVGEPAENPDAGQGLPDGGNALPHDVGEEPPLGLPTLIGEELRIETLRAGLPGVATAPPGLPGVATAPPGLPALGMAAPVDPLAQPETPLNSLTPTPTPMPTVPLAINALQMKVAALQTGTAAAAVDADALPLKQASADPLRLPIATVVPSVLKSTREIATATAADKIDPALRPVTSLDPDTVLRIRNSTAATSPESLVRSTDRSPDSTPAQLLGKTLRPMAGLDPDTLQRVRPQVSGSSPDPLAGLIDRLQGPASTTTANTTLLPNGIAAPVTTGPQAPLAGLATTAPALPGSINVPLQDAAWGSELNSRVLYMAGQNIHRAEIRLNPAELGPITINVAIDDGAADVTFLAQHAVTREAIEQAMPRLRELLSENGLLLGNTSVTEQGVEKDGKGHETKEAQELDDRAETGSVDEALARANPERPSQGLIDTFA